MPTQQQINNSFADPYSLDEIDRGIIKHLIEYPGSKRKDLCIKFNLKYDQIKTRLNKPAVQRVFKDMAKKTMEIMEHNTKLAARRIAELINHKDPHIALKACEITLKPYMNQGSLEIKEVKEVIYRARFGEDGEIFSDKEEIIDATPKNTLELLKGGKP